MVEKELLRSTDVALLIGCSKRNITKLVKSGKLTPTYKGKLFFLFEKTEVDNYLKRKLN